MTAKPTKSGKVEKLRVELGDRGYDTDAIRAWCAERGVLANSLRIESRTLEDVFLELTGKELRS